jgi:succinoglycan biosynthesis transport protein ExoP
MDQRQSGSDNTSAKIRQVLVILKGHRYLVFLCSLVFATLGIVGISLLPDQYKATTTILVDPQKIPERYVSSTVTSDPNERLNTLKQQVLSSSRLQEIIDRDNLYSKMRKQKSREEILDFMRKQIKIELVQGSDQGLSSFTISYDDKDRWLVAPITNQLAASFIDWNLRVRQQQAHDTAQFLSTELEHARRGLQDQEDQLQAFKLRHVGGTPDQLDANLQVLSRLQSQLQSNMDAISRLDEERIMLMQTKSVGTSDTTSLSERGHLLQEKRRLEGELWNLKRQFTDTYPDVVIAREELKNVESRLAALPAPPADASDSYDSATQIKLGIINKELERHRQQQTALQQQIASYQGKVDSVPVLETQMTELTRNYEISRQNYQSLLDKSLSAGMSQDLERQQQAERFIILDPARTPEKPFTPKRLPLMAGAVLFALLIVPGVAVGSGFLLGRVGSEYELKKMLPGKIQILGTIPPITSRADLRRERIMMLQTVAAFVITCVALIVFLHKVKPTL